MFVFVEYTCTLNKINNKTLYKKRQIMISEYLIQVIHPLHYIQIQ